MTGSLLRSAVVLGLLSAVGPFAIDMYLPAMPALGRDLGTDVAGVQLTLTAYFVAFGLAQLIYGPLSDQVGRKPPLYAGLAIFILATVACAAAPSIGWLVLGRVLQGAGAAVLMVVPRAIIRDMLTGVAATRLMAMVMLVISVSPMLAPLAGSGLIALAGWRAVFVALLAAAALSLAMTALTLPETLAPAKRVPVNLRTLVRGSRALFGDPLFMGLTFIGGFGMASFFVFLASASFVYTGEFGLSPTGFSLAFALNAIGFFSASQLAARLGERFGMTRVVATATAGFLGFAALLLGLDLAGLAPLPVIVLCLLCGNACLGLVIPSTMVMALDAHGDIAGLASSLGGTLQMLAGGLMIVVSGQFFDGTATPMIAAIAGCAAAAFVLSRLVLGRPAVAPAE